MTPTREQVIRLLIDAGHITCHPSNYTSDIDAAVIAYSAGRLKGLEEAAEVCEHATGTPGDCAASIDQLKEQTP